MVDEPLQLDLTVAITDVPQANSLGLFIRHVDAVERGVRQVADLAELLEIEERTVHYYLDFGKWLGFMTVTHGEVEFSEVGHVFGGSVAARQRLFTHGMFSKPLIQTANALISDSKDDSDIPTLETHAALLIAIKSMTKLADSTAERRASGLAQMLDAAYHAKQIDWKSGAALVEYKNVTFEFKGRTFLTAMAARQFSNKNEFRIGFPLEVAHFVEHKGHHISATIWKRASYDSKDKTAIWFGGIPVNPTTIEIAERGGRDLRKLVTMCAPYVTLLVACLSYRDVMRRPAITLSHDMYGVRLWNHDRDLGSPIEFVEKLAHELGVIPISGLPRKLIHEPDELTEAGGDKELIQILVSTKIVRERDTIYEVAPGFEAELREGSESSISVLERLRGVHDAIRDLLQSPE